MRTKSQKSLSSLRSIFLAALIIMMSQVTYSQSVLSGFGLEIGYGYSQLFSKYLLPPLKDYRSEATHYDITTEVRLNYNFQLTDKCACIPFVGYNRFGGSYIITYLDQSGSEKIETATWVDVLEIGLITTYNLSDLSFGICYKANRQFKTADIFYFPNTMTHDGYRAWSHNAGLRVSYIVSHYSISAESWFGITDLESNSEIWNIRQNHFRILIGYTIESFLSNAR